MAKDAPKALGRYRRLCESAYGPGCYSMALVLRDGAEGVPVDPVASLKGFERACERDPTSGCREAGQAIACGRSTPRDGQKAFELLLRACKAGDAPACDELGYAVADPKLGVRFERDALPVGVRVRAAIAASGIPKRPGLDDWLASLEREADGRPAAEFVRACLDVDEGRLEAARHRLETLRASGRSKPTVAVLEGLVARRAAGERSMTDAVVGAWGAAGKPKLDGTEWLPFSGKYDMSRCGTWRPVDYSALDGSEARFLRALSALLPRSGESQLPDELVDEALAFSRATRVELRLAAYAVLASPSTDARQKVKASPRARELAVELARARPDSLFFRSFAVLGTAARDAPLSDAEILELEAMADLPFKPPHREVYDLFKSAQAEAELDASDIGQGTWGVHFAAPYEVLPERARARAKTADEPTRRRLGLLLGRFGDRLAEGGTWLVELAQAANMLRTGAELSGSEELQRRADETRTRFKGLWSLEGTLPGLGSWPLPSLSQDWDEEAVVEEIVHTQRVRAIADEAAKRSAP
ncbi:MAG: hypothetical protein QM765_35925 [Myxococcales bacterium]